MGDTSTMRNVTAPSELRALMQAEEQQDNSIGTLLLWDQNRALVLALSEEASPGDLDRVVSRGSWFRSGFTHEFSIQCQSRQGVGNLQDRRAVLLCAKSVPCLGKLLSTRT